MYVGLRDISTSVYTNTVSETNTSEALQEQNQIRVPKFFYKGIKV